MSDSLQQCINKLDHYANESNSILINMSVSLIIKTNEEQLIRFCAQYIPEGYEVGAVRDSYEASLLLNQDPFTYVTPEYLRIAEKVRDAHSSNKALMVHSKESTKITIAMAFEEPENLEYLIYAIQHPAVRDLGALGERYKAAKEVALPLIEGTL